MTTLRAALTALRTTLTGVEKLAVGIGLSGQVNPPYAVIGLPRIENFRQAMAGSRMLIEPTITLLTSASFDEIGTLTMADYLAPSGSKSIYERIEKNRTLGGVVEDCQIVTFDPLNAEEYGAIGYFGGTFTLRMMARG